MFDHDQWCMMGKRHIAKSLLKSEEHSTWRCADGYFNGEKGC